MTAPPIPFIWTGEAMVPEGSFRRLCAKHFGEGEIVILVQHEERSETSHKQEFAWIDEVWASLPEHLVEQFPSPLHLRKRALISTGWCTIKDYVCTSRAEARRLAAALRGEVDEYALVVVADDVVRVCKARSQARNKMKKADFETSKAAILEWIANLLEVEPATLARQKEHA